MDRTALLQVVARVASAAALGQDDAEEQRDLNGKRIEMRIRFGCSTDADPPPQQRSGPFSVRFDDENRTLRVRIAPDLTLEDPRVAATAGESVEAVEGFWLSRPWLLRDGCPVVPPAPAATEEASGEAADALLPQTSPALGPQRVGIARFFTGSDARTGRRDGRAYEAVKVLDEEEQPSDIGYNLVLSGRLRQPPGGRVISCRASSADTPPDCLVSAEFDRVWIEVPRTGAILGEWGR